MYKKTNEAATYIRFMDNIFKACDGFVKIGLVHPMVLSFFVLQRY